jgi:hypothetical protein
LLPEGDHGQGEDRGQEVAGSKRAFMLLKSARRYKQANIGDSVMVHLPEVDRSR